MSVEYLPQIDASVHRVRNDAPTASLIQALASAVSPVIVSHVTPDVDAIASMLGLARCLPTRQAQIVLPIVPAGHKLRFLLTLAGSPVLADAERIARADMLIAVDTASTKRANLPDKWDAVADKFVVNIDHHITNTDYGRINWVVDNASSTAELIYRLAVAAGWTIDPVTATILYAGIYSDTGAFSLPNATAESFEAAADLVRRGADVEQVGLQLNRAQEQHEFDLIRTVYHNTRQAAAGRIAYSTLSYEEIQSAGCSADDIDDQVSIPRSLSRVQIALLFSEAEKGVIRINLRGEGGTPVLPLAEKLGGGGHTYSAGVRVRAAMDAVVPRVLAEAQAVLGESNQA